jgi:hypothetical protein
MVKKRLEILTSENGDNAVLLWEEIEALTIKSLRKIKSQEEIKRICHEVISAVGDLLLVHIDEWMLESQKPKKWKYIPLNHTDDSRWENSAIIWKDWNSERWLDDAPRGYVYYDNDKSLIGTIYAADSTKWYEVFIEKEIADNPIGAKLLIREMKKKLGKLLKKSK